jgi:hypothetical protein
VERSRAGEGMTMFVADEGEHAGAVVVGLSAGAAEVVRWGRGLSIAQAVGGL